MWLLLLFIVILILLLNCLPFYFHCEAIQNCLMFWKVLYELNDGDDDDDVIIIYLFLIDPPHLYDAK